MQTTTKPLTKPITKLASELASEPPSESPSEPTSKLTLNDLELCAAHAREVAGLRRRIEDMRALSASAATVRLSPSPRGSQTADPVARAVAHIDELERDWLAKIEHYTELVQRVERALEALPDPDLRTLLRLRYIDGLIWDEIAPRVGYVDRWCRTLCAKGLRMLGIEERARHAPNGARRTPTAPPRPLAQLTSRQARPGR